MLVTDFVSVLEEGIEKHGMSSEVYSGLIPNYCKFKMDYVATRKWDIVPYLVDAQITLYNENEKIGSANYHLKGGGGLALTKWKGTKSKIAPIIDELFANTTAGKPFDKKYSAQEIIEPANSLESKTDELRKLHQLKLEGIITEEEFNLEKKKILDGN